MNGVYCVVRDCPNRTAGETTLWLYGQHRRPIVLKLCNAHYDAALAALTALVERNTARSA